jgi:hypothetical protein
VHLGLAESEDHRALSDSRLAIAYCHAAEMEKTYRLDRIREIHAAETRWPVGMCWLPGEPNGGSAVFWSVARRSLGGKTTWLNGPPTLGSSTSCGAPMVSFRGETMMT